ncbi:MAG TPA: metallophosphoesterase [Thermoanaerobaculia bacterium]
MKRNRRRLLLGALLVLLLALADAFWIEPRLLLFRDDVRIDLPAPRLRIAHLSDLHVRGDMPLLHRLVREVAAARPDVIVISGDLIHDVPDPEGYARNSSALAALIAALRRIAPVYAVQGHSEHQGELVELLQRAGLDWLSNEGRRIGPDGGYLLLGLNTQVGLDHWAWSWPPPFRPEIVDGVRLYGATRGEPYRSFYSHFDPAPAGLADLSGPLAWSGYEATCDLRISNKATAAGLALHSRHVDGEDRLIELSRDESRWGRGGTFSLFEHGSALVGRNDTGVRPQPGTWYHLKVRTEVEPGRVLAQAKVWPASGSEPSRWQAMAEDRSPLRVAAGTVGLWSSGGGTAVFRDLRVVDHAGKVLLDEPLVLKPGERAPRGFRVGTRGTRLALALARSPQVPRGTPVIVLAHMGDVVREASRRGLPVVLAGHTHGGQVRFPILGALLTRSSLGPFFDRGRFEFAAPNDRGWTTLYINPGIGMSVLPVRFDCPPRWALVELGR